MAAYQQLVMERLEEGLRAIQQTGISLMHEIAGEVWRAAGGDKDQVQAHILEGLARDQAIRGLIAHSDERFQALAVRTARLEDTLTTMAESSRALKEVLAQGAQALHDAANSPALSGFDDVRERLTQVEQHLAATFERLDERDRILIGSLQEQIRDHGALIHQETGRIVEALEGYVKDGVDAMGRLAQRVEQQTELVGTRTEAMTEELAGTVGGLAETVGEQIQLMHERVEQQTELIGNRAEDVTDRLGRTVGEQIQLMYERIGIETRALTDAFSSHEAWILRTLEASSSRFDESLEAQVGKVREVSREIAGELARSIESRVYGLAELVRSDSEVIRRELLETAATQSEEMGRALDERLGRVSEALTAATRWTVEEMTRRIGVETSKAVRGHLDEVVTAIDRNMVRFSDTLDSELDRLGQSVGQRAAQAADEAVAGRFDRTLESMGAVVEAVQRTSLQVERAGDAALEAVSRGLDDRIGALARMIRSDNRILAERLQAATEQETAKQALRAIKELQASLPADITELTDRRFAQMAEQLHRESQATAESVAKAGEVLGQKVDRIAASIGERYDRDMQSVIERMGDAMHALASLGKPSRIELD